MKNLRKIVILCLIAIVGITATIPSTFSWYSRAAKRQGGVLRYEREDLPISAGTVNIKTVAYETTSDGKIKYDSKGNKVELTTLPKTVQKGKMQYYKTTLTSGSSANAYVNLYLTNASNSTRFFVGTINPVVNEKQVGSPTRAHTSNSRTTIYFQLENSTSGDNKWKTTSPKCYIWAKALDNGTLTDKIVQMTASKTANNYAKNGTGSKVTTYYANLPENTSEFFISKENSGTPEGFSRTRTFSTYKPSTLYYLTGKTTDDSNNYAECFTYEMPDGVTAPTYYSSVTTAANRSIYLSLPSGTVGSVSYSVVGTVGSDVLELDEHVGRVKVKSTDANGKQIKTTVTGPVGDTTEFITTINVPDTISDFPLIQNVLVQGRQKVVVEWYISNTWNASQENVGGALSFGDIYYTY